MESKICKNPCKKTVTDKYKVGAKGTGFEREVKKEYKKLSCCKR